MKVLCLLFVVHFWGSRAFVKVPFKPAALRPAALFAVQSEVETVEAGKEIGRGSYGVVNHCSCDGEEYIGKRHWQINELDRSIADPKGKVERCQYYWEVEEHCFKKLGQHKQLPVYRATQKDDQQRKWMLFEIIESTMDRSSQGEKQQPAPSLQDLMKLDHEHQHDGSNSDSHHLSNLQRALGVDSSDGLGETLDVFLDSLLEVIVYVHAKEIVHRDLKPANLLIANSVFLIDFGSAADLDSSLSRFFLFQKRVGMESRVAISPVYAAPELFIDPKKRPQTFDVFSVALIYCQLLFNLLDERTDAGFHQQLQACKWDLDLWLEQQLASKVTPLGLLEALDVLSSRPGLWNLLTQMFSEDPSTRISSQDALKLFRDILAGKDVASDGDFFQSVVESFDTCPVVEVQSRPLHFVATFRRSEPLGLVLAEPNLEISEEEASDETTDSQWISATRNALPGQVFVKEIILGGQADRLGIIQIGDQLQGVGEIPLAQGGFDRAVALLQSHPTREKYVTLHFDRRRFNLEDGGFAQNKLGGGPLYPLDFGAWSTRGRLQSQEDRYILHEFSMDSNGQSVLLAGVMDGHGGTAASSMVSERLPELLSFELSVLNTTDGVASALGSAWETVCYAYQRECEENECSADYDPVEGILSANTGAQDLIAGTTASLVALDERNGLLSLLNCGDSRTVVFDEEGCLKFETLDHTPEVELDRLTAGKASGLDYSIPTCIGSKWRLSVGDYSYSVARSLEGPFASSKGITSSPDITTVQASSGMIMVSATDGLWAVMDSQEVAKLTVEYKARGVAAGDAAKRLCSVALERMSPDNVSCVVVYLS